MAAPPLPAKTETRKEVNKSKATKTSTTKASTATPETTTKAPATTTTTTQTSPATTDTDVATTTPAATPQKKGMSNSAKGAIIGGGAGAVGGAIISKKRVRAQLLVAF